MEIQTKTLLPEKSFSGFPLKFEERTNTIYVWYHKPQGGKQVEFEFPKFVEINSKFVRNLALCIGDGLNNPSKRNTHCNFANNNLDLVEFIYDWWQELRVPERKISVYICASKDAGVQNFEQVVKNRLKCDNVKTYILPRHRVPTITIQLGSSIFQSFYLNLFDSLREYIVSDEELRRAFLAGLFAAEGHVKHSIYGTLESISYAFNPKTELNLAEFVIACLAKENISAKISRGQLYFCNYEQMLRFYLLGLANLHKKKEEKFKTLSKNANVTLHFKPNFLQKHIVISQRKLAKILGCSQSSLSLDMKYNRFGIKKLKVAFPKLSKEDMVSNTEFAHVGTSKVVDKASVTFLIDILFEVQE